MNLVSVPSAQQLVPKLPDDVWTGWTAAFCKWVEPTTDGSYEGIFAIGSGCVGAAIGRAVGIQYGRPTYANQYGLLIGRTGAVRKSTLVSRGRDVIEEAYTKDFLRVCRSIGSGEGLLESFCDEVKNPDTGKSTYESTPGQRVLLEEPEFCNLLKKARRPGTANITEYLLTLFDEEELSPRTRSKPIKIVEPFFSIITTTTPENLEHNLIDIDIESGLIPRFVSFYCTPREPIAYPPPPDEIILAGLAKSLQDITRHAKEVGKRTAAIPLSTAARADWELTFKDITAEMRQERSLASAIMERVPTMIMKWALIYSMQAGEAEVSADSLARATLVGTYLMETARLVPQCIQKAMVARIEARVVQSLSKCPGQYLTANQIHRLVSGRIKAHELQRSLDSLAKLGVIQEFVMDDKGRKAYSIAEN